MKGLAPPFLGIFGTFAFSWVGLTVIPNWQIGHLNPQSDEEGTDHYPMPQSGMVERGARVYAANGCVYCHSQQVRADYAGADIERKWGDRRSAPRDYIFERPVFLAKMRMGQDLANVGARAPAEQESPQPAGAATPAASPAPTAGGQFIARFDAEAGELSEGVTVDADGTVYAGNQIADTSTVTRMSMPFSPVTPNRPTSGEMKPKYTMSSSTMPPT